MILRNYYNYLAAYTLGVTSSDTTTFGDGHINFKDIYGVIYPFGAVQRANGSPGYAYDSKASFGNISTYGNSFGGMTIGIQLGTGDTAVSYDDYKLDSAASNISGATFVAGTPVYDSSTKKWTNTASFLLTNSGSSTVTIREVGLLMKIVRSTSSTDTSYVMVYREVLETPFTLTSGESKTYVQNLEFTMPS